MLECFKKKNYCKCVCTGADLADGAHTQFILRLDGVKQTILLTVSQHYHCIPCIMCSLPIEMGENKTHFGESTPMIQFI